MRHLRLVAAIAEAGSVTKAGEVLHLTQSALSHQLRDIEMRLNTALFHRLGRRMVPTAAGRCLIGTAAEVLKVIRRTEDQIKAAAKGGEGTLRISVECYTGYHWLPPLLKEYRRSHPMVEVLIDAAATSNPVKALLDGHLDLAIVSDRTRDRRIVEHPLFDDPMVVITAPSHPFATRAYVRPEDFRTETLFTYASRENSTVYQQVLVPAGVTPRATQQVQLTEAIVEMVKAGLGIAVLSAWAVAPYVNAKALAAVRLTRRGFERKWKAVTLKDMAGVGYVSDFIKLIAINAPRLEDRQSGGRVLRLTRPRPARSRM